MMNEFLRFLFGALIIASAGVFAGNLPRIAKAWREGDRGPYLRFLVSIAMHAAGILIAAAGRLIDALWVVALGLVALLSSKQVWQWPIAGEGRLTFLAQLAGIAAWACWVFTGG